MRGSSQAHHLWATSRTACVGRPLLEASITYTKVGAEERKMVLEEAWGQRSTPVTDRSGAPWSSYSNDRLRKEPRLLSVWSVDG